MVISDREVKDGFPLVILGMPCLNKVDVARLIVFIRGII